MQNNKIWFILFIILLLINISVGFLYILSEKSNDELECKQRITELEDVLDKRTEGYLGNARELKYLLETLLNNAKELKQYMPEYKNIDVQTFKEKLRQKIVRLEIKIEELENN
jgi:hypothetical protein